MSTQSLRLVPEPFDGPAARELVAAAVAENLEVHGVPSSEERPRAEEFEPPHGVFLVAYAGDRAIGCGGLKRFGDEVVEVKRMYVVPPARGTGVGRAVLAALESVARERGYVRARLETGTFHAAALGLYRSAGYGEIPCWGGFASDPLSVCLEKSL